MEFEKNGLVKYFKKKENESLDIFSLRCQFIMNNLHYKMTSKEYNNLVQMSKIYINNKIYNCSYSNQIMSKLHKYRY